MASYPLSFPEEAAPFPHGTTLNVSAEPIGRVASMIGRTGELLSGGLQQASQSIFEYEERARNIQNTINNNNATTQYAKQGLDITQGFLALKGDDALRAQDDYKKKLDDLGESMLADPNLTPKQRAMLSSSITSLGDRYRYRMADHAATQQDFSWKKSIMESGDQAALSLRETSVWGSPELMEFDLQSGINAIRQPGLGATDNDVRDYTGKTIKGAVDYQLYLNNPDKAQQILEHFRKRMDPASVTAAERAIEGELNTMQGAKEGRSIYQEGYARTQGLNSTMSSVNLSATSALGNEGIDLSKVITEKAGNSVTYSLKDFSDADKNKVLEHFIGDRRIPAGGIQYDGASGELRVTVGGGGLRRSALPPAIGGIVDREAARAGLDPNIVRQMVWIESHGRPGETTGSYHGLLQLSHSEFTRGGGTGSIFDPEQNLRAGVNVLAQKAKDFERDFGRPPTAVDLYMLHQQGEGGTREHLRNPDQLAWRNMYATAEGQRRGVEWSKQAIWGQAGIPKVFPGGVDTITSRQFFNYWRQEMEAGTPMVAAR